MDEMSAMQAREACQRLVTAFAVHVDGGQGEKAVELFAADGSFERKGERLNGQGEIRAAMQKRSPQVVTRHLQSPSFIELQGADRATGVTYFQLFRHTWPEGEKVGVGPLDGAEVIGEYHDEFRRTAAGWRIHARVAKGVFRRGG